MEPWIEYPYELISLLGEGNSASVYLAQDMRDGSYAACKIVPWKNVVGLAALEREWDILSMLDHPAIPRPIDCMETSAGKMLVMTHMPGITPVNLCPPDFIDSWEEMSAIVQSRSWEALAAYWGYRICHILSYLHNREDPLIYGDLKPANLKITEDGSITMVDLGTACFQSLARRGKAAGEAFSGTVGYAAPEQYPEEAGYPTPATDIYALGILLREWLQPVEMSERMRSIIDKCTAYRAADRWYSADVLSLHLRGLYEVRRGELFLRRNW